MTNSRNNLKLPTAKMSESEQSTAAAIMAIVLFPLTVWFLMLAFGFVHDVFNVVPAIGFWDAALLALALWIIKIPNTILKMFKEELKK